jgi:hypothetical protein
MNARASRRAKRKRAEGKGYRHSHQPRREQLRRENDRLLRENEELRRKVAERERQIAEREKQIADGERQIAEREKQIADAESRARDESFSRFLNACGMFNRRAGSRQGQLALLGMQDKNTPRRPVK